MIDMYNTFYWDAMRESIERQDARIRDEFRRNDAAWFNYRLEQYFKYKHRCGTCKHFCHEYTTKRHEVNGMDYTHYYDSYCKLLDDPLHGAHRADHAKCDDYELNDYYLDCKRYNND